MLKKYESIVILNPELSEKEVDEQLSVISEVINTNGGNVTLSEVLGRRPLSYRIAKKDYGVYTLFLFEGDSNLNTTMDRQLRLNEKVLRHLVVLKDRYAPDISQNARDFAASFVQIDALVGEGDLDADLELVDDATL